MRNRLHRALFELRSLILVRWKDRAPANSVLHIVGHNTGWSLDWDVREMIDACEKIGIEAHAIGMRFGLPKRQAVHFTGAGFLDQDLDALGVNRFSFDYYHGRPGQSETFTQRFENLKRHRDKVCKVRVSNSLMRETALEAGIPEERIALIPIAVNTNWFQPATEASRKASRLKHGIPKDAFVLGSFQKDGNGWGEGNEAKWEKGPDVFLETVSHLKSTIPNLHVFLTGPARGFVKRGLEKLAVPYTHVLLKDYLQIGECYHALDAYLISSREEGGPKAVLESMGSGVPLVSTRCGQAVDLVNSGENGFLEDLEDAASLAARLLEIHEMASTKRQSLVRSGIDTAIANSCTAQIPMWKDFFSGYVPAS